MSSLMKIKTFTMLVPESYVSKDVEVSVVFPAGAPPGTEGSVEVEPPTGYMLAIGYFKLITPPEVVGNIVIVGADSTETKLLASDQEEGVEAIYSSDNWGTDFLLAKKIKLLGRTTTATSLNRELILRFCGGLVKWR
jgi:hypothetical protein